MTTETKWTPRELDGVDVVFPTTTRGMMPEYKDIPKEFTSGNTKWNELVSAMFFTGLKKLELKPKPGIDQKKALRHIRYILGSFEPKHEHKEAGAAFLFNEWFESVDFEKKPYEPEA